MRILSAITIISLLFISWSCQNSIEEKQYVVMLSMDGFRWDYPDFIDTPVLDSLKSIGVKAESLKASYPTKTFPNHYTIATGLYPDNHGIVLNGFYADDLDKTYSIFDRNTVADASFYGGEPIWITAEKQGLISATLFWVGSEAPHEGLMPSYWKTYDHKMPYLNRVDTVAKWLSYDIEKRPDLVLWYVDEPDSEGHASGPYGAETAAQIKSLDSLLGVFFTKMRTLPFFDQINFIITSDHGMNETADDRKLILDEIVDTSLLLNIDGWNPNFNLRVKNGFVDEVFSSLKEEPNIEVWKHGELPKRLNYGNNSRTHDITLVAKPGWSVYWSWDIGGGYGAHGYDNDLKDMHAIFYAAGPAFKNAYVHPTFENVNIYPLIAKLLGLEAVMTDGNLENVKTMLVND